MHQIVADTGLDALEAALGKLWAAGWLAPEGPDSGRRELAAAVRGLARDLDADSYSPGTSLRPAADWPDRAVVAVVLA